MASHLFFIENRLVNKIREVGLKKKNGAQINRVYFFMDNMVKKLLSEGKTLTDG